jgi:hypothetical protein
MVSTLCPSPRDAKLERIILVVFRGAFLPAAAASGFAFFVAFACEVRVLGFALVVFDFALFVFAEGELPETARLEFLRAATFLRELFFLVFFLVAMPQVYHCGPAQFILVAFRDRRYFICKPQNPLLRHGWLTSMNSASHGFRSKSRRATVIGKLNLRGPALPGFIYRMPSRVTCRSLWECPLTMMETPAGIDCGLSSLTSCKT